MLTRLVMVLETCPVSAVSWSTDHNRGLKSSRSEGDPRKYFHPSNSKLVDCEVVIRKGLISALGYDMTPASTSLSITSCYCHAVGE